MKNWWPSGWETSELPKLAHVLQSMPVPAHAGTAGQLPEDEMNRRSYLQPLASETTEDCGLFWAIAASNADLANGEKFDSLLFHKIRNGALQFSDDSLHLPQNKR